MDICLSAVPLVRLTRERNGISEADAARYADLFEKLGPEDFGPPRSGPGARRGRKSLAGTNGESPRRGIRLPEPLDARYRRKAAREGRSVSAVMREVLTRHAPRA
jgi:hypothetical protein